MNHPLRACELGMARCHTCGLLARMPQQGNALCPRCQSRLHLRRPNSVSTTWALWLAAAILYLPANLLPVMTVVYLGAGQPDTIMSGIIYLFLNGNWPLALIVFVASMVIPILKLLALAYLLVSVQRESAWRKRQRTLLYRITELIGRWSMVDVFVVALLAALVQLDAFATISPGLGASAFAAVVILTMLAAMSFDPRLIWDHTFARGNNT